MAAARDRRVLPPRVEVLGREICLLAEEDIFLAARTERGPSKA